MHTLVIDNNSERRRGPLTRRDTVLNKTYHVWFGLPDPVACWLRGHRPQLQQASGGPAWVRCARCGQRPALPGHAAQKMVDGWVPTQEWLDDLDARNGWTGDRQGEAGLQVVVPRRPRSSFAAKLHLGGLGSETPVDAHLDFAGYALYGSLGMGHHLCQRITGGRSRDLELSVRRSEGRFSWWVWSWSLWADDWGQTTGTSKERLPRWRHGRAHFSLADKLLGKIEVTTEDLDSAAVAVDLADGFTHLVEFTLQHTTVGRPGRRPREDYYGVDWNIARGSDGIGTRMEGGRWARRRTFGSWVQLSPPEVAAPDRGWIVHASARLREWTRLQRAKDVAVTAGG